MAAVHPHLIVADGSTVWLESARRQVTAPDVRVLVSAGGDDDLPVLPNGWERLPLSEVVDQARLCEEFLRFLDDWPSRPVADGRSFDDLFRHSDGYSVWWTGPGIERNAGAGIFVDLQTLWALDQAIGRLRPAKVYIYATSAELAAVLVSRCERAQLPYELLDGSTRPGSSPWVGRSAWLFKSLRHLVLYPARVSITALVARLAARTDIGAGKRNKQPAIVFTSQFSRCVQVGPEGAAVWYWQALCSRITALAPSVRCCHLFRLGRDIPGYRAVSFWYHTAWPLLRTIDNTVPPKERYTALGGWLRSVPRQLIALAKYSSIEAQTSFRESFSFAGADVSPLYVPRLREAIAGISDWAQTVGAIARSLAAAGDVRAMVLYEEMYRPGMINIAAARALGVPTIGVQHGMIMPGHLIYMLPPGQVRAAPIPDYFAATSEYVKDVMSQHGAYPADRIWVTGSPRLDQLINQPPDRRLARERLGVPQHKQVVLVTTQTAAWFPAAVRAVFEAAKSREQVIVCVKVHPKTRGLSSAGYGSLAQQVGASNVLCFDDRFDDLLAACDVLVSGWSTTILEAILLGRQTICVNLSGQPDGYPYVEDGASVPARSPREVEQALDFVLSGRSVAQLDAHRQRFLQRHSGPSSTGGAGSALAGHILAAGRLGMAAGQPVAMSPMTAPEQVSAGL